MYSRDNFYEIELGRYTALYFLLGVVEHELRARVPMALSDYAFTSGKLEWWESIPQSFENLRSIEKAKKKNGNSSLGFEQHLPFSFWRFLFVGENYLTIWRESLHSIFPRLSEPRSKKSFDRVCNRIYRAYVLRNKVAHYEFHAVQKYENEKNQLLWLIYIMGGPSV
ncbi:MAG: hypothetical protein ACKOXI_01590 [Candidatus Planktophila sp.]